MRIIFSNYFFIIKITLLLCFLVLVNYESIAQSAPACPKKWRKEGKPAMTFHSQDPPPTGVYTSGTPAVKLQFRFSDFDQYQYLSLACVPGVTGGIVSSLPNSSYDIEFSLPNTNYATFSPLGDIIELDKVTVSNDRTEVPGGNSQATPSMYISGPNYIYSSKEVILRIKPDWESTLLPLTPPDIIVTVKVTDKTTPSIPSGDTGGTDGGTVVDILPLIGSFTIKFRNTCPTGLAIEDYATKDNVWFSYNNPFSSCINVDPVTNNPIQYNGDAPYCYTGIPDIGSDNISDYIGTLVTEEITNRTALFQMSDVKHSYRVNNPHITNPDALADLLFPKSTTSTFTLNNDDKFEDVHSGLFFLDPATLTNFLPIFETAAFTSGVVGYTIEQVYKCAGNPFPLKDKMYISRRLNGYPTSTPQVNKKH